MATTTNHVNDIMSVANYDPKTTYDNEPTHRLRYLLAVGTGDNVKTNWVIPGFVEPATELIYVNAVLQVEGIAGDYVMDHTHSPFYSVIVFAVAPAVLPITATIYSSIDREGAYNEYLKTDPSRLLEFNGTVAIPGGNAQDTRFAMGTSCLDFDRQDNYQHSIVMSCDTPASMTGGTNYQFWFRITRNNNWGKAFRIYWDTLTSTPASKITNFDYWNGAAYAAWTSPFAYGTANSYDVHLQLKLSAVGKPYDWSMLIYARSAVAPYPIWGTITISTTVPA